MNSTGIVRKIDELGRIVIPKEIRKTLKLSVGTSMEIILEDNKVILQKYSSLLALSQITEECLNTIFTKTNLPCLITDNEKIISVKGISKKFLEKNISKSVICELSSNLKKLDNCPISEELTVESLLLYPIVYQPEIFGSIIIIGQSTELYNLLQSLNFLIDFLAKQLG